MYYTPFRIELVYHVTWFAPRGIIASPDLAPLQQYSYNAIDANQTFRLNQRLNQAVFTFS